MSDYCRRREIRREIRKRSTVKRKLCARKGMYVRGSRGKAKNMDGECLHGRLGSNSWRTLNLLRSSSAAFTSWLFVSLSADFVCAWISSFPYCTGSAPELGLIPSSWTESVSRLVNFQGLRKRSILDGSQDGGDERRTMEPAIERLPQTTLRAGGRACL
jgi:hypothetical protein